MQADKAQADRFLFADIHYDAGQKDKATKNMHHEVAKTCCLGSLGAPGPYQPQGADRQHLPEHKEGKQVSGEDYAKGTASINQASHVFQVALDTQGVNNADKGDEVKYITKKVSNKKLWV